jgi:hypothetical protein
MIATTDAMNAPLFHIVNSNREFAQNKHSIYDHRPTDNT